MPLFSFEGKSPRVDDSAYIAPTATLIGDVTVEAGASVWFGAVLRADDAPIVIRAGANVQDNAVLHVPPGVPVDIGVGATVAHLCVVHGAQVGAEALIGNQSTILDGAKIGSRCMVAAGSLVRPGTETPDEVLVAGSPAKVMGPIAGSSAEMWVTVNPGFYQALARRYRDGMTPLD